MVSKNCLYVYLSVKNFDPNYHSIAAFLTIPLFLMWLGMICGLVCVSNIGIILVTISYVTIVMGIGLAIDLSLWCFVFFGAIDVVKITLRSLTGLSLH